MPLHGCRSRALVPVSAATLVGDFAIPPATRAVVLFLRAGGAGPLVHHHVSTALAEAGLAILLLDLLTETEAVVDARTGHVRFDVPLLAARLADATDWALAQEATSGLRLGYFGASTTAAAALVAAAARPKSVSAVVSLGGRTDLAAHVLEQVHAPTLFIVAGDDLPSIGLHRGALLHRERRLEVIPGAGHLFAEPGTLETVTALARRWFERHLTRPPDA